MTRKRFKKLLMSVGIPRNDLSKHKLKKGQTHLDTLALMECFVILDENATAVDKAAAMMVFHAISKNKPKLIGTAFHTVSTYRNTKNLPSAIAMESYSENFINKYKSVYDSCVKTAKDILGEEYNGD